MRSIMNVMVQRQVAFEKTKRDKALNLNDISPKWAKRLERQQRYLPVPMSIAWLRWCFEITSAPKCIVGEAYGFTSRYTYGCRECGKIGDKFSIYFMLHSYSKLEANKQRFVKHWNEQHITTLG